MTALRAAVTGFGTDSERWCAARPRDGVWLFLLFAVSPLA